MKLLFQKFLRSDFFTFISLAVIIFLVFSQFIFYYGFGDGDMFYHITMAQQIFTEGLFYQLSALPYTSLGDYFINHHLGFHLLLIPFQLMFGIVPGAKIVHFLGIGIILFLIYKTIFRVTQQKFLSIISALLPLTSILFISRLSIEKATSIAVAYSLLYIYLLFRQKYKLLVLATFGYVYLYGGWPIAIVLSFVWMLVNWSNEKQFTKNIQPTLYTVLGVSIALLIHPQFPQNIFFYYEQIIKIAFVNDVSLGFLAAEWMGYSSVWIYILYATISLLLTLSSLILLWNEKQLRTSKNNFIVITTILFLLLTIKTRRYVEYYIPFASLNIIVIYSFFIFIYSKEQVDKFFSKIKNQFKMVAGILLVSAYGLISQRNLLQPQDNHHLFHYDAYASVIDLKKEMERSFFKDEPIFHVMWEEFPMLWHYAPLQKYISGLDPRFLLYKDADVAKKYYDITQNKKYENILDIMSTNNIRMIVINRIEQPEIEHYINSIKNFELRYIDKNLVFYELYEPIKHLQKQ